MKMDFTSVNQFPEKSNELIFIDVDPKPSTAAQVKHEQSSPPAAREKFSCSECSLTVTSAERMTRHMRKHRGENPYQCSHCPYSTYNSTLFQEHDNAHKGIKPYKCSQCDYRSVSKKYMKKHESRHVTCSCGHVARDVRRLRRHATRAGCEQRAVSREFKCEKCNVSYITLDCLKQHQRTHRTCPECGETYSTKILLKHRKDVHGVKCEIMRSFKFKCQICEWKSSCHQKILLHLIHHPGQTVVGVDITPLVKAGILSDNSNNI